MEAHNYSWIYVDFSITVVTTLLIQKKPRYHIRTFDRLFQQLEILVVVDQCNQTWTHSDTKSITKPVLRGHIFINTLIA